MKFNQTYKGLRVYGAETQAVYTGDKIISIASKTVSDIDISISPKLSYDDAMQIALNALTEDIDLETEPELIVYGKDNDYQLAWTQSVRTELGVSKHLLFGADTGEVLLYYSQL